MITTPVIDTHRLSILAHAYEREMVHFFQDLTSTVAKDWAAEATARRMAQEMQRAGFDEIRNDAAGDIQGRIGSGKWIIRMDARVERFFPAGMAALVYAGKLIQELGMYSDFTLWVAASAHTEEENGRGLQADSVLVAEPTGLCIRRGHRGRVEVAETHPLVQSAIATYETLFELPPLVAAGPTLLQAVPTIGFGPGDENGSQIPVPPRHLVKAAQFYAAFPRIFVDTMSRH